MQILLGVLHIKAIVRPTGHWHRTKSLKILQKKLSLLIKLHVGLKLFTSEISYKDISVTFCNCISDVNLLLMMVVMWLVTTFVVAHTVSWAFDDYNGVDDDEYENYNDNGNGHYICGCKWNDIFKHCI